MWSGQNKFLSVFSFNGDLIKHVRSKHSESSEAIMAKIKELRMIAKKSSPNKKTLAETTSLTTTPTSKVKTVSCPTLAPNSLHKELFFESPQKSGPNIEKTSKSVDKKDAALSSSTPNKHFCPHCKFGCKFKKSFVIHLKTSHPETNPGASIQAPKSTKSVEQPDTDKTVDSLKSKKGLFICSNCPFATKRLKLFNKHLKLKKHLKLEKHLPENQLIKKEERNLMSSSVTQSANSCSKCSFVCSSAGFLKKHLRMKHKEHSVTLLPSDNNDESQKVAKNHCCSKCDFKTCKSKYLIKHLREKHARNFKTLKKKLCKISKLPKTDIQTSKETKVLLKNKSSVTKHGHLLKKFSCPICSRVSKFKVNIQRHMGTQHPGVPVNVIILEQETEKPDMLQTNGQIVAKKSKKEENIVHNDSATKKKTLTIPRSGDAVKNGGKQIQNNKRKRDVMEIKDEILQDNSVHTVESEKKKKRGRISCSKCPFVASRQCDLIVHFDKAHLKRGTDKRCPHCNYRTRFIFLNKIILNPQSRAQDTFRTYLFG